MKIHRMQAAKESEEPKHMLYEAIAAIRTDEEAKQFFQDLCTPSEIQAMADRWLAVYAIKAGKPYRQVYDETGVSVTTVGRVARCIMMGEGGYNLIYARVGKKSYENSIKTKNRNTKKRASKQ